MRTNKASIRVFFSIALLCCIIINTSGCSTAKPVLKAGTYRMTIVPPGEYKSHADSTKECVIQSDLDAMRQFPGPVPRTVPRCELRNYKIAGNHVSYEQYCLDNTHMAGGDMVIYWDFVFSDKGYEGTMRGKAPKDNAEMQTRISAEYLSEGCQY